MAMPILVKMPSSQDDEEWGIIELQGDIKSHSETNFEGKFIGDLHYTKTGNAVLIIGHHLLYGKEANLEKPFVLLEKRHGENNTEYIVKTIIKRKIIFKVRPKPIVTIT